MVTDHQWLEDVQLSVNIQAAGTQVKSMILKEESVRDICTTLIMLWQKGKPDLLIRLQQHVVI